jgi:hypothetical protein
MQNPSQAVSACRNSDHQENAPQTVTIEYPFSDTAKTEIDGLTDPQSKIQNQ